MKGLILRLLTAIALLTVWCETNAQSPLQNAADKAKQAAKEQQEKKKQEEQKIEAERQSLRQKQEEMKRLAEQKALERKQEEENRYYDIINTWDLSEYDNYLREFGDGEYAKEIRERADELRLWERSKKTDTPASYRSYLNTTKFHIFDDYANYNLALAIEREEQLIWQNTVNTDNYFTYQEYIDSHPQSEHLEEARQAMTRLETEAMWSVAQKSNDPYFIQEFIDKYPGSSQANKARKLLHELKGRKFYDTSQFEEAYKEFSYLDPNEISPRNKIAYETVCERHDFEQLSADSPKSKLAKYIEKYPRGRNLQTVKGWYNAK